NRCRKLPLAYPAGTFQTHGRATGVIVGAGSGASDVKSVAVARIVVPRDQHNALRIVRIGPFQDCVNISNLCWLRNSIRRGLGKTVSLYFEAAATIFRIALEFGLDPFARRANAAPGGDRCRVLRR